MILKEKSILANAFFNVLFKLANVLFPVVSSAYVARILLSGGVGRVTAVSNNVSYFIVLATLGIPAYGIREVAKRKNDKARLNKLFSELILINTRLTIASCLIFIIAVFILPIFKQDMLLYLIYGVSIALNFVNIEWFFYGIEEYRFIAIRSIIFKIFSLLLLFLLVHSKSDIYYFAAISVFGTCGNYFSNLFRAKRYIQLTKKSLAIKCHIKPLLFLSLCSISTELYARMDITMLNIMKDVSVVGYYGYSHRVINLLTSFLIAVTNVFLPRLSFYYENDRKKFDELMKFGTVAAIFISLPAAVGLSLISSQFLTVLFGEEFAQAKMILCILTPIVPLKMIGDLVCYQVMICSGGESNLMKSYLFVMVVNFVNNMLLIPQFSAEGAAMASVISEILAFLFVFRYSRQYLNFHIDVRGIFILAVSLFIMSAAIIIINKLALNPFILLVMDVVIGGVLYFAVNYLAQNRILLDVIEQVKMRYKK